VRKDNNMNEDYAKKARAARALNALGRLKAAGRDPALMTDSELLKVGNLGIRSIPVLREMISDGRQICAHCGLPTEKPTAHDSIHNNDEGKKDNMKGQKFETREETLSRDLASCRFSTIAKTPNAPKGSRSALAAGGDGEDRFGLEVKQHKGIPAGILLDVDDAFRLHRALSNWLFHMVLGKTLEHGRVKP